MLIVDTGFLVALYILRDKLHQHALSFLQQNQHTLITSAPVIVESCYFLDAKAKIALLNWVVCGGVKIVDVPVTAYCQIAYTVEKYADHGRNKGSGLALCIQQPSLTNKVRLCER